MDVDALAREVAEGTMRLEFESPPFPPYFPSWMERMRAKMPREFEETARAAHRLDTFDRVAHERLGDLDVYLYRVEPGAEGDPNVIHFEAEVGTAKPGPGRQIVEFDVS